MASNTTTSKSINIEHLEEQSDIILYCWINYHHSMEDNSNMSGSTTSETDEVGGNGEDVSAATAVVEVFGNDESNDIADMDSCINKVLCLSSLSLASIGEQYGSYLVTVLRVDRREIYKWWTK